MSDTPTLPDYDPDELERLAGNEPTPTGTVSLSDFLAYLPEHRYIYRPTGDLWPADSVNGALESPQIDGKTTKPSRHLDQMAPIHQMTWSPGEHEIIDGRLAVDGGWTAKPGARTYNLYRPPHDIPGDPAKAGRWYEHMVRTYGDDAEHISLWFGHRVQCPDQKLNHALVLGGSQGIGKDTLLAPLVEGVGAWNFAEISPAQMLGRFNGWVKSIVLRVSEGRDLGDVDRFAFYDHTKTYIASPPDMLRVDEKNRREYPVFNRTGVIITTNHKLDGIYLPPDDRRHYVAWSECTREDFSAEYWRDLWAWYDDGGIGHVVANLRSLDLSTFDAKAPPPRTAAFDAIVQANHNPDELELADLLESAGWPPVITVTELLDKAGALQLTDVVHSMTGSRNARKIPHRMDRAGYELASNPNTRDGRWKRDGRNVTVYARKGQTVPGRVDALRRYGIAA